MPTRAKLSAADLRLHIDLTGLDLQANSPLLQPILGQERAQAALTFAVAMPASGYNLFVMGESGLGRLTLMRDTLQQLAQTQATPPAYAYVDHFAQSRQPIALRLPAGQGHSFSQDIEKLLDDLLVNFPAAFENKHYQQKKTAIERQFEIAYKKAVELVEEKAESWQIALLTENENITFSPLRDDKALNEEQFGQLPKHERVAFEQQVEQLEDYLSEMLADLPQWRRTMQEKIRELNRDSIENVLQPLFAELNARYETCDDVVSYLAEVRKQFEISINDYLMPQRSSDSREHSAKRAALLEQYLPNVLVEYAPEHGAPVIYQAHPTYQNVFGHIDYVNESGSFVTHYRRIHAGSLHQANGGYLILNADEMLQHPFVWEALKRALQSGYIEIESPYAEMSVNTMVLKPEVIPLNIKIILLGSRDSYYFLEEVDKEFTHLFRVVADFDQRIIRNESTLQQFAQLLLQHAQNLAAKPLTQTALECLLEHSCRLAESQQYFSGHIHDSLDLIGEANWFCQQAAAQHCDRIHIEQALAAREYRNGRMAQITLDEMLDGSILIDTDGAAVGKINGLTVLDMGGNSFGAPARITTTVSPGSRGIVDIEREAELGQEIHSKGVLILTGYLGHFYAQQFPLAISASIALEQSYCYIDGDSASLAELCCLISALTRTPIKQSIAVTGSINQYGEVQPIGGVNEKIEGFFSLCQARGLNGSHAVIIPAANQRNLMLKQEVVDAVAAGLFAVYTVTCVNETLELLTGQDAGALDEAGNYPENSINFKAIARLKEIAELAGDDDKEDGA